MKKIYIILSLSLILFINLSLTLAFVEECTEKLGAHIKVREIVNEFNSSYQIWQVYWFSEIPAFFSGVIKGDIFNITYYNTTLFEDVRSARCSSFQSCLNYSLYGNTLTFEAFSALEGDIPAFKFYSNSDVTFDLMQNLSFNPAYRNMDKVYLVNEGVTPGKIPFTLGRNFSEYYYNLYFNESKAMIIVIDGVYAGHVNQTYMPHVTGDLKTKGKWYSNIWTHGRSYTTEGHNTMITGMNLWSTNGPLIPASQPTLWNYLSEKYVPNFLRAEIANPYAGGMYKTIHPGYNNVQATNRPFVECREIDYHAGGNINPRPDEYMTERVIEQIRKSQGIFWFINLADVDFIFHRKVLSLSQKFDELKSADEQVYRIIQTAESNPFYTNKTTYFITTDHSRFQEGLVYLGKSLGVGDYADWNHYYGDIGFAGYNVPVGSKNSWMPFYYQGKYSIENKVFLLVIGPNPVLKPGSVDDLEYGLEDIAPTVADIFQVSMVPYITGKSLFVPRQKSLSFLCFKNCLIKSKDFKGLQMCVVRCLSGAES